MSPRHGNRSTILYVEDDDDTRPGLSLLLSKKGYRVMAETSEEAAIERAFFGRVDADLILIDLAARPDTALSAGRRIRRKAVSRDEIPIVVIAYRYGADMEGSNVSAGETDWITYLEDAEQLENLINRLLTKQTMDDEV